MKKVIKWGAILAGVFFVLIIAALLIIPKFVDIQKYKPEIEKKVAEAIGRPFTLGGDLHLSLFPWAGISCSDIRLGNPPGFTEKEFVTVESMEVRVKLVPLISKDIQGRFILNGPRVVLERRKDGRGNWEGIAKPSDRAPAEPEKEEAKAVKGGPLEGLPIASLAIEEFAITDGFVLWIDHAKGERKELSDANIRMTDVSLDRPIHLDLAAKLDGRPLSLKGDVGPLGKEPGKGRLPLDISVKALDQIDLSMKGEVVDPATRQQFDLALDVSPFSPRKLMTALGQTFPVTTTDPEALNRVAFKAKLKGDPRSVTVSDGVLDLDESKLVFSMHAVDFSKPDATFDLNLDQIDLNRYLPPADEKKPDSETKEARPTGGKKIDYTPLRRLVIDGKIRVGTLQIKDTKIHDFFLKVAGKDGKFRLDPLSLKVDKSDVSVIRGDLDVRQDTPQADLTFNVNLDTINLSPFVPVKKEKNPAPASGQKEPPAAPAKKNEMDYAPLRRLALDGTSGRRARTT